MDVYSKREVSLLKHRKKFHSDPETVTRTGTDNMQAVSSDDCLEKKQVDKQELNFDDFGEDPDIEVCEMSIDIESKDSCTIRDITSGRMLRKPTRPDKVYAPKKQRLSETETEVPVRSASDNCMSNADLKVVHYETKSRTEKESLETVIGDHQDGQGSLRKDQEKLVVKIDISKDRYVSSNLSIHDNDERLLETFTINKYQNDRVEPDTNLGDFLPTGTVLKAEDIVIKRVLTANGGKVILDIKH